MQHSILNKIKFAEDKLNVKLPSEVTEFIATLKSKKVTFKTEDWFFYTVSDSNFNANDNFIYESSQDFQKAWGINGVVIASNGIGDYLVLLPDKVTNTIKEDIYISLHEYAEIRLFAEDIFCLQLYGPEDYFSSSDFYIKLDNENIIYGIQASESYKYDQDDEIYGIGYGKRFQLDDMIDKNQFEKSDYILQGLEELRNCGEEELEIWALNKLSEVYLKGFGSISADLKLAIDFCQEAMTLNSHKAYSNMAAAFLYGIGVEKNLEKALKLIEKAHQISKTPTELDVFINKKRKGLYLENIKLIKKAIKENQK